MYFHGLAHADRFECQNRIMFRVIFVFPINLPQPDCIVAAS